MRMDWYCSLLTVAVLVLPRKRNPSESGYDRHIIPEIIPPAGIELLVYSYVAIKETKDE